MKERKKRTRSRSKKPKTSPPLLFLDRLSEKWTLKQIGNLFRLIWNVGLTLGVVFYIVKYKLEIDKYFISYTDYFGLHNIIRFLSKKWEVIILGIILLGTIILLNLDNSKYIEHAENCFSRQHVPTQWKKAPGRYIVAWVILSNIVIFLSLAYFIDDLIVFCALFALHHWNAVFWLIAFRWNVHHYFYVHESEYMPPDHDPQKRFILKRRKVMEDFLCKTPNIEREGLTALAYVIALLLAIASQRWGVTFYWLPYIIIGIAEVTNQYVSYRERVQRDRGLGRIAEEEARSFDADRQKNRRLFAQEKD